IFDQFPLPHSRGSSHGHSRITRKAYGSADYYTRMMEEAYKLWETLEHEAEQTIFKQCGCLVVGPQGNNFMTETTKCLERYGIPHTNMSGEDLRLKYPMLTYPADYEAVLDHSGGVLRSDIALTAFQTLFKKNGGHLHDGEEMTSLIPGKIVTITTNVGQYKARGVVLTVGPWATKILPPLGINVPLKPMKVDVCYWREKKAGVYSIQTFPALVQRLNIDGKYGTYALPSYEYPGLVKPIRIAVCYWKETKRGTYHFEHFPTLIEEGGSADSDVYALPNLEYPGHVKVCLHNGPDIDPDRRDSVDTTWVINTMCKYVRTHFNGLEDTPSIVETCIYTNTPDHDFILDTHPVWKNIVIGAGFSGHGFKLAPVVGKLLSQLALGHTPSHDMGHFKIDRFFQQQTNAKL
ncbi:hypothetical protein FSP39_008785, partial [Pinctada imbricata]